MIKVSITVVETDIVCAAPTPHEFIADTENIPPKVPAVVVIELVEELPDQPKGSVQ